MAIKLRIDLRLSIDFTQNEYRVKSNLYFETGRLNNIVIKFTCISYIII